MICEWLPKRNLRRWVGLAVWCFSLLGLADHVACGQTLVEDRLAVEDADKPLADQLQDSGESDPPGDRLRLKHDGSEVDLVGDILIEGQNGSLYFQQNNGRIWFVQPEQIVTRKDSAVDAVPASFDEMKEQLLGELPDGFRIYKTKHYLIAYQTELAYAKWLAQLYELRLYRVFEVFWQRKKKFDLHDPKFPLVAVVFKSKAEYQRYMDRDLGPGQDMVAYYNFQSNRVAMYDLTLGGRRPGERISNRRIEEVLRSPAAIYQVATIIHEATHQLTFNRGIQTRFADTPLWLNEGLAMFFEAPDVNNRQGWRRAGLVFDQRLTRFRNSLRSRPDNAIEILITDDDRLRDPKTALDGYAEAWAFNHFLLNRRSKQFVKYLQALSKKEPLSTADAQQRIAEFKQYLGSDLGKLERDFLKYVRKLK